MLQILIKECERFSIAEQAQMALEGGALWLVIRPDGMDDAALRASLAETVELCKETPALLTIEGHTELAAELGLHGVLLLSGHADPMEIRRMFGPEAIIGAEVKDAARAAVLEKADIDYVAFTDTLAAPAAIAAARAQGTAIPFVALGNFTAEQCRTLHAQGFDGVCTGKYIFEAEDPVAEIEKFISVLAGTI